VGCADQMVRIPLGLELEPFLSADRRRGALRRELGIPASAPLVGIVARLVPIKAHDLFLSAARRIADTVPNAHFLIIGDGECRPALEQQAHALGFTVVIERGSPSDTRHPTPDTRHPTSSVHFLGFRSDLVDVYADLDVVVLCSRNEGMPVTIIEALAAARPVVATEVGAVRDLVIPGRTGRLAECGNPEALAAAVVAQLTDGWSAAAMAMRGREHVYPRLSIERLARDIRNLYAELAEEKGIQTGLPQAQVQRRAA
jgi:glycosyltransferase involved in cell wall biosynthesis